MFLFLEKITCLSLTLTRAAKIRAQEDSELVQRRLHLAQLLLDAVPRDVMEDLDQARDSARCLPLYNHVVGRLNALRARCETAQHYLALLREALVF